MTTRLIHGDCLDALPRLVDEGVRVDAVVTDPPYHLASIVSRLGSADAAPIQSGATGVYARSSSGFMGQQWDGGDVAFRADTWRKVFAIMRPGAHLVAFGGTRTYHRMAVAIEDAGFEIRDQIGWLYGTGFPKSHNLDGDWDGWGTALKPAWEPIVVARKPLLGSVPENMALFGTGAINIDACRVAHNEDLRVGAGGIPCRHDPESPRGRAGVVYHPDQAGTLAEFRRMPAAVPPNALGRWPANVVHDGSDEVLDAFAGYGQRGALAPVHTRGADKFRNTYGAFKGDTDEAGSTFRGDSGTAARFFYSAKATAEDRAGSNHPTVKPIALMRWLVRLICPPGGLVLDPFAGTGTTGAAAITEGMQALLIEQSDTYVDDICRRLGIDRAAAEHAVVRPFVAEQVSAGPLFDLPPADAA